MPLFKLPGLSKCVGLGEREIVSAYGAGGKTSFLLRLAEELSQENKKVILTTTTHILPPRNFPLVITSDFAEARRKLQSYLQRDNVVALGSAMLPGDKVKGIEAAWVDEFFSEGLAPYILVEADGAARRPIKGYAPYEPVIPQSSTTIVPVLGADALGLPIEAGFVHRPELLVHQIGAAEGGLIGTDHFIRCLFFMLERGRRQAPSARAVPVVNKADLMKDKELLYAVVGAFSASSLSGVSRLLFTALSEEFPVQYIWGKPFLKPFVSCAILSAGFSRRMGEDKLSLRFGEKTILEHAVGNALQGGADEIFIVTRPEQEWVEKLFSGDKIRVVKNPFSAQGMSTSIKAAISACNPLAQGVIFALGDQPFIDPEVYRALIKNYSRNLNLVTYPLFQGKKGNPQIFDRRTWPLLLTLQGDRGGRGIIPLLPEGEIRGVETPFPGVTVDIDTAEEYMKYRPPE
ncbi:MAG: putative selenium-dependent hydroxylase accessory protein YqeC [Firmicutes bacterium]|nr:putative selenium-dependent hydroxylase accessory protein YqeC [Bacillota bacterium]